MKNLFYLFLAILISCSKFEEQNPKLCLTPHIDFVYTNVRSDPTGLTIQIDSVVRLNDINKVTWDFGDGKTSTTSRPLHIYPKDENKQSYKISLTAENDCGTSIWYKNVNIGGCLPIPDFDVIVSGYTVSFVNKSKPGDIPIKSYLWNFGNGQSSNLKDPPPITYTSHGSKKIYLTVYSDCDNNNIWKEVNIACDKPIICQANCIIAKQLRTDTWEFSNGINNVDIRKTDWEFGDGSNGTGSLVSHTYEQEGRYNVTIKVTNICNQVYTFQTSIDVTKPSTVADREYNTTIIQEFNGKGPFHQISYFKDDIYVLANDRSFFKYNPILATYHILPNSPVIMNEYNILFKDVSNITLSNYGTNGFYKYEVNEWKIWRSKNNTIDINYLIGGYDCSPQFHRFLPYLNALSVRYNSITNKFYFLTDKKHLYSVENNSEAEEILINTISAIDKYSKSLINNNKGELFFTFTNGIAKISTNGEILKLYQNLRFQPGNPKKIIIDNLNVLYSLDNAGNLVRINQATGIDELITTNINDFDLIQLPGNITIVTCDNTSVKIMKKKK